MDSLGAVEFRNAISAAFPVQLPATAAYDYPTAAALAAHISAELAPSQQPPHQPPAGFVLTTRDSLGPVLEPLENGWTTEVVGMACVYPGSGAGVTGLCYKELSKFCVLLDFCLQSRTATLVRHMTHALQCSCQVKNAVRHDTCRVSL